MSAVKDISQLAAAIESIQHRTRFGGESRPQTGWISTGWSAIDTALGGGLMRGAIHEWFAPPLLNIPPLAILIHLAWRAIESSSHANSSSLIIWIGRRCWPHPRAMIRPCDAQDDSPAGHRLLDRSFFIDLPPFDDASRLWAIDLALRSSATCAVIADGSDFDMAATRRLQLAAETGRTIALFARPRNDLQKLSSATTRWIISPQGSSGGLKPQAFPTPQWTIELLRCKGVRPILPTDTTRWALELNHVTGALDLHAPLVHRLAETA